MNTAQQTNTQEINDYALCLRNLATGEWRWFDLDDVDSEDKIVEWTDEIDEVEICDYGCEMLRLYGDRIGHDWEEWCGLANLALSEEHNEGKIRAFAAFDTSSIPTSNDLDAISVWESFLDYATDLADDCYLHEMPNHLARYFDYEAFARDLSFETNYTEIDIWCYIFHE